MWQVGGRIACLYGYQSEFLLSFNFLFCSSSLVDGWRGSAAAVEEKLPTRKEGKEEEEEEEEEGI